MDQTHVEIEVPKETAAINEFDGTKKPNRYETASNLWEFYENFRCK